MFEMLLIFQSMPRLLQRVVALRKDVLDTKSFTSVACKIIFPSFLKETDCMNWCLFRLLVLKRIIAYVEGKSCREVGSIHS